MSVSLPSKRGSTEALGRLRWHARWAWERIAWPEFLAIVSIGFAIGVVLWINRPLRREVGALRAGVTVVMLEDVARLQRQSASGAVSSASTAPESTPSPQPSAPTHSSFAQRLMDFLPAADLRDEQLHTLHSLAADSQVELARVEYGHAHLEHLPGQRMTMQLSIQGEYAAYRKFLHHLLVAMPNLAVDRVTMEQAPGQAARLNIRLENSLYYRNDAGKLAPGGAR